MQKVIPITVWAVVNSDSRFDCWDSRVPVFWLRREAVSEMKVNSFSGSRVIKVQLIPIEKPQRKGAKR